MKAKLAISALAAALSALPAMAQGALLKATGDEVLQASLSAVKGQENTYPVQVAEQKDAASGDTLTIFTLTGPADEVNEVIAQCQIRLNKESGLNRESGILRQVSDAVPICGDQYRSMRDMITIDEITASFAIRQTVLR